MRLAFGTTMWMRDSISGRWDGLGIYTQEIYKALNELNIELAPYSFTDTGKSEIELCRSSFSFPVHAALHYLFKFPIDDMKPCLEHCDILFTPDHHIAYSKEIPVVATVMDIIPIINRKWASPSRLRGLKNYLFESAVKRCDRIITVSEHSRNDIVKYLGISKELIDVVPLGVDRRFFEDVSSDESRKILSKYSLKQGKYFLNIGTIQPRKNLPVIIEAHKSLPESIRKRYPLIIVGKYGWSAEKEVEAMRVIENSGYGKWISYISDRELIVLLKGATAMLYPSLYEGFGLPVLEAFASGCPVIASNNSSIPEVAGDCAFLLDPNDVKGFADMMLEVIEGNLSDLIKKAKKRAESFTWRQSAIEHLSVFKKLMRTDT